MRIDPAQQAQQSGPLGGAQTPQKTGATGFGEALQRALATGDKPPVSFSKHALQRLEQRAIRLDDQLLRRLSEGLERAAGKGSRTTLILIDQTAFVVGVGQRTVVTVAEQEALKERVFTNIDSMVIA